MADKASILFNKKATEKLRSPDDLDKYVQVTNPSIWILLAACIAFLAGLLAWGFFGAVTTSVATTGVYDKGQVVCFLEAADVAKVDVGDEAAVDGREMKVSSVSSVPMSKEDANSHLTSDYIAHSLVRGDWVYMIEFEGDFTGLAENVPLQVSITTENLSPISLIVRNRS